MERGDWVIYRMSKSSASPGRRAKNIRPSFKGESYSYQVDKFWVVVDSRRDGTLEVATRRGKRHVVDASDVRLRHARWWERWLYSQRFPALPASKAG